MNNFRIGDIVKIKDKYLDKWLFMDDLHLNNYQKYAVNCYNQNIKLIITGFTNEAIRVNNYELYYPSELELVKNDGKLYFTYKLTSEPLDFNGFSEWERSLNDIKRYI